MKFFSIRGFQLFALCIIAFQFFTIKTLGQWSTDPMVNNAICVTEEVQAYCTSVSDGSGGAIITWEDRRSLFADIFAQKINASGVVQWTTNGLAICTAANIQDNPTIASDGAGGAIITWADRRNGNNDIYSQRINASGVVQWTANGVAISTATLDQVAPKIISDGSGGAIITWEDTRSGSLDIYAQCINASGVVQWTSDGVVVSAADNSQSSPTIIGDGSGGAILTWEDLRSGSYKAIYAQSINASGVVKWPVDGVEICTATNSKNTPTLVSDGVGGAIITWYDIRNGNNDIYAQRINASGVTQWTANGVAVCTAAGHQYFPTIISNGTGGAIITWVDRRSIFAYDIYAQNINASGVVQWIANGLEICTASDDQSSSISVSDGAGGAIIAWYDLRSNGGDIYAQRINGSGVVQWTANGLEISTSVNQQESPTIVSDGAGGAIITWNDARSTLNSYDIYTQQVNANGILGVVLLTGVIELPTILQRFTLQQNFPNPFDLNTKISFTVNGSTFVSLKVFNIFGQEVSTLVNEEMSQGSYEVPFGANGLPIGVYIYRMTAGSDSDTKVMVLR